MSDIIDLTIKGRKYIVKETLGQLLEWISFSSSNGDFFLYVGKFYFNQETSSIRSQVLPFRSQIEIKIY